MKLRIIIISFLLLCFASSFAQKVTISGIVSNEEGLPIELADVSVEGTIIGDYTDTKGKYSISLNVTDSITVVFSCMGYNTNKVKFPPLTEDVTMNVRLRTGDYALEGITVTALRPQTDTMETVDVENTRFAVDATGGSVESIVIISGTGVSQSSELSTQYSVRGGSYNENIVYVNGIEIYRPLLVRSGQQEGLSFINPDLTGAVQFSSGGFDARYGDKMSSVLDVTYKTPTKLEGGVTASMLGANAYIGSASSKFTQVTGFRYKSGTTLLKTLDTKGDYEPVYMDFQTYMSYAITPKLSLSFMANYSDNKYDFNPEKRETSYGTLDTQRKFTVYYDGMEEDRFRTLFGAGILKYVFGEHADVSLQVSGFQSKEEVTYDLTGEYFISNVVGKDEETIGTGLFHQHARNKLHLNVFKAALTGNLGISNHNIRWGIESQWEEIKDRNSEWELIDSVGFSLPVHNNYLTMKDNLQSHNEIKSNRFSAYVQDTYKFRIEKGLLSVTAGIRGSYWDYNEEFIISPRASLGFIPTSKPNITLRFSTGLYYQAPFYKEFRKEVTDANGNSSIVLNKDIKSQRSIHFVLGGDYTFRVDNRPFKFTAELYYKKLDDLVPYTVDNVKVWYSGENTSHGYAMGIDTKFFGQFVPGTDSWLGFSLMQAKQYIDGEKVSMPTDQLYNFTFYYTDYLPQNKRIQFNLRAIWSEGLPFNAPGYKYKSQLRARSYRRVDIGLSYCLWGEEDRDYKRSSFFQAFKSIHLGVDVFNLLDISNVSSYSWFSDVNSNQHAVPDKLTGRQINLKLMVNF